MNHHANGVASRRRRSGDLREIVHDFVLKDLVDERSERALIGAGLAAGKCETLPTDFYFEWLGLFAQTIDNLSNGGAFKPANGSPRDVAVANGLEVARYVAQLNLWQWPGRSIQTELDACIDACESPTFIDQYTPIVRDKAAFRLAADQLTGRLTAVLRGDPSGLEGTGIDLETPFQRSRSLITSLETVVPDKITWLWPQRIAIGKFTLIAGDPGLGKSTVMLDMAARVSQGFSWPDGAPNEPGGVVIVSAEDGIADTIVPRLTAAGANLKQIKALEGVAIRDAEGRETKRPILLSDIARIEEAIDATPNCRLVDIDPISAFLGDTDSHKNAEVRAALAPLSELAARKRVAIVAVDHLSKSQKTSALYRVSGSVAFTAASRAVWMITKDPKDDSHRRRLMLPGKNNLADDTSGLAFCVKPHDLIGSQPVIAWEAGPVRITVDEALEEPKPYRGRTSKTHEAREWLAERLKGGAPVASAELIEELEAKGIKEGIFKYARGKIGAHAYLEGEKWFTVLDS